MTITRAQLKWMQPAAAAMLTDTADIYDPPDPNTASRNASGFIDQFFPSSWTKLNSTARPCRVDEAPTKREVETPGAGQVQAKAYYDISFGAGERITERSRVLIRSSLNANLVGRVYDVDGFPSEGSIEKLKIARCVFVKTTGTNP